LVGQRLNFWWVLQHAWICQRIVVVDSEIINVNCVAADLEIGNENYIAGCQFRNRQWKLYRCQFRNQQWKLCRRQFRNPCTVMVESFLALLFFGCLQKGVLGWEDMVVWRDFRPTHLIGYVGSLYTTHDVWAFRVVVTIRYREPK